MDIQVLYPKKNYSGLGYIFDSKIEKRNYDENGNFLGRESLNPSIDQYEVVGEHTSKNVPNTSIFKFIVEEYNIEKKPSEITTKIKNGELNVGHSSFSTGDVIKIKDKYYISDGIHFAQLPTSFTK